MKTRTTDRKELKMAAAVSLSASSDMPLASIPFQFNTRLIAAVQTKAGARCHESANLVQAYYFRADVYRMQMRNKDAVAAEAARRSVQQAETQLRRFLTDLSWPCSLGGLGEGRVSCDCHAVAC
jgi:hypothetical protein